MLEAALKRHPDELADAHWIGGPGNAFCRHEFSLRATPISAILKVVADAHTYAIHHWQILPTPYKYEQWLVGGSFLKYRVFLNGSLSAVGPFRPLEDGTPVLQQYNVTAALKSGRNAIAVLSRGEKKGFALCLDVVFADGSRQRVLSTPGWKQRDANNVYRPVCWECPSIDQFFKGSPGPGEYQEHLDGELYPQGWKLAGFDDASWANALDKGKVLEQCEICRTPPYQLTALKPVSVTELSPGNFVLDFGRAVFGGIELQCPEGGGVVELRLAEELQPSGHARFQTRSENCYQELWKFAPGSEPLSHLGARMFRYAEVLGWRGEFASDCIRAIAVGAPFDMERSSFTCDEPRIEKVWQFCKNTVAHTTADVYTDCLSRERLAYEVDCYVAMLTQFCTEGTFETARRTLAYLRHHPTWPCEWWQCYIPLFHEYLLQSGDYDFVAQHFTFLRDETSFHGLMRNGLIHDFPREKHVDWPPVSRDGYEFGDANAVPNAYAYWDLILLSELSRWTGRSKEAGQFNELAAELKDSFNRELFDQATGLYVDSLGSRHSSLHTNMYALRFGLVPQDRVAGVLELVKRKGMACSVFTAQFLLETLFQHGEDRLAVDLMTRDGDRSWLDMMNRGAVATTEAWLADNKPNMSWAHPWGSSPASVIVRHLFGIRPTAPGWTDYAFDPRPGGLERGQLSFTTPRGRIHATFELKAGAYEFAIDPEFERDGPQVQVRLRRFGPPTKVAPVSR
jgi:alpha-L-rhamnosidase